MTTRAKIDTEMTEQVSVGWTNVDTDLKGDTFTISIDLSKSSGQVTASGKGEVIATTHGNYPVPGHPELRFAVNCYRPLPKGSMK